MFTGIKDKNGKKIFVGDVLEIRARDHGYLGWEYETRIKIESVDDAIEADLNSDEIEVVDRLDGEL